MSTLLYNRILVIDDNPAIHKDFQKIFAKATDNLAKFEEDELALFGETTAGDIVPFFEVDCASQGQEGVEKIRIALENNEPYALAFVDSRMPPGWDGIETISHIWEIDQEIQIVICSAYSDYSWEEIIKNLGNTDRLLILKKPFDNIEVRQLASALSKKWHLAQQVQQQLDGMQTAVEQKTHDLNQSLSLVKATLEAATDGILVTDLNDNILVYNQKFLQMWQLSEDTMTAWSLLTIQNFLKPQLKDPNISLFNKFIDDKTNPLAEIFDEIELQNEVFFERYFQPQRLDAKVVGKVISFRDITRRKQMENQLAYQATHDALTGLPNRVLLLDRIKQAAAFSKRQNKFFATLFIDLDRFKLINDSMGHKVGDQVLQTAAARLNKTVRDSDTVVRLGGDEFVIVLTSLATEESCIPILHKLLKSIADVFVIDDNEFRLSASIGISLYPKHGEDADTLLKNADAAMYRAKDYGRNNFQFYTEDMNIKIANRLALESDLHRALERGEFLLHYQPVIELQTGKIISNEALLRWQHPKLGLVPPQDFIPLAEETGFLVPLGEWILKEACTQNRKWQDMGLPPISIAVNVSGYQLKQNNLLTTVNEALQASGLDPKYLELEFTETVIIENADKAKIMMNELKEQRIKLLIDDFGTGYSSLSYLQHFPIDKIKIDRSFVSYISSNSSDTAIILAIINIASALKMRVVAEGVENQQQLDFLRDNGCDEMQGFYFSRPQAAEALTLFMKNGTKLEK